MLCLHLHVFTGTYWPELTIVVNKNKVTALDIDDHIELTIPGHILKRKSHCSQVLAWSNQGWPNINLRFRGVPARKFNDLDMAL